MARIFITGSSDGLGQIAARSLIAEGHRVTLHARNASRAKEAMAGAPGADGVLVADLSSIAQTKRLASEANEIGAFDTVIHNAGVGLREPYRKTEDGIAHVFAINSLAPYILTCLMERPKRLVYVSSGLHSGGDASLNDVAWTSGRSWDAMQAYSDSKLHNVLLTYAVARHWRNVSSNVLNPGWVKTKMGGSSAPGSAENGAAVSSWLASSDVKDIGTGKYYASNMKAEKSNPSTEDIETQEEFLQICEKLSEVSLPK